MFLGYHSNTVRNHYHKDIFGSSPSLIHKEERRWFGGVAWGTERMSELSNFRA